MHFGVLERPKNTSCHCCSRLLLTAHRRGLKELLGGLGSLFVVVLNDRTWSAHGSVDNQTGGSAIKDADFTSKKEVANEQE